MLRLGSRSPSSTRDVGAARPAQPRLQDRPGRQPGRAEPEPPLQPDLFRTAAHTIADEIARLKGQHLRAVGELKRTLSDQIAQKQADLEQSSRGSEAAPHGSVDWRIQFAEVFDRRGGFDIVVANPPYVRHELIRPLKPRLQAVYGELYSSQADLLIYFYLRGLQLLSTSGMLIFISSNKWLRAKYGEKLRTYFATRTSVSEIIDFGDLPVFSSANAYPMIIVASNGPHDSETRFTRVETLASPYPDVSTLVSQIGVPLSASALSGGTWTLVDEASFVILKKLSDRGVPLLEYVNGEIYFGIKTGLSAAFVISGSKRLELMSRDPKS